MTINEFIFYGPYLAIFIWSIIALIGLVNSFDKNIINHTGKKRKFPYKELYGKTDEEIKQIAKEMEA